jgi:CheY-like chemotaxis protein
VKNSMTIEVVKYIREIAQTCIRFARACPHSPTSHGLEEIAMDLMAKAKELERLHVETSGSSGPRLPKPVTIFIIDDDVLVRESMETLIRTLGYVTETFVSAEDCLGSGRIAEASCLITDVHMQGMNGFELHSRLHANGLRIPVIFMSGCTRESPLAAANKIGAIGFLEKPVNTDRLIDYLDKALKSQSSD